MSNLKLGDDDFPAAAEKMLMDSTMLRRLRRHDGAAYLTGYAVECSLKTLLLVEGIARAASATTLPSLLRALAAPNAPVQQAIMKELKHKVSHKLLTALQIARGTSPLPPLQYLYATSVTRRYISGIRSTHAVLKWDPMMRYHAPGRINARKSKKWCEGAKHIVEGTVLAMRADGLVTG